MSQDNSVQNDLKANNTTSEVNKKRLSWTLSLGSAVYVGSSVALYDVSFF